jgi:hypothetical protein
MKVHRLFLPIIRLLRSPRKVAAPGPVTWIFWTTYDNTREQLAAKGLYWALLYPMMLPTQGITLLDECA